VGLGRPETQHKVVYQLRPGGGSAHTVPAKLESTANLGQFPFIGTALSRSALGLIVRRCSPLQRYLSALVIANPDGLIDL
jgi:hypothetical protein